MDHILQKDSVAHVLLLKSYKKTNIFDTEIRYRKTNIFGTEIRYMKTNIFDTEI